MFQSKLDKTKAELDKTSQKLNDYESLSEFIGSVYEDEEVRHAFLSDLAPDLVKPKDPYQALEEQLRKEFGEDFTPDEEEAKKPLSKAWKYYKRLDDLYKYYSTKQSKLPKSLGELKAERARKKEESAKQVVQEKTKVLQTMKWGEADYGQFAQWVGKLTATDLAKIYKFARSKSPSQRVPNIATQSGGYAPAPNQIMANIDNFFGK
jgi:chromosome segregation ATPase